jgi:AsmA protein
MSRILKILGVVVGVVVLLFVVVAVAVTMLFDPNDYKDDITAAVERTTGRALTLEGDLSLAVFPTIRIAIGAATLSNAPGFGAEPMARIEGADLSVALLPLLSRRIQVREARLEGLTLNLARDARGRNNWQDLSGEASPEEAAAEPAGGSAADLDLGVGAVEIADARVVWSDASTGSRWELTDFGLEAEGFGLRRRFPLRLAFGLAGTDLAMEVDADMHATLDLASNEYQLDDVAVTIDGSGAAWPGGPSEARLTFDSLVANLQSEALDLGGLTLDFLGVTTVGSLSGRNLMSDLALAGAVEIREFAPRMVLERLGVVMDTADGDVLARASANADLLYNSRELGLREMRLVLDDSTLTGRVVLEGERVAYDLTVDDINVDRYLPPSDASDAPADEGSLDEVDLPLEVLRTLDARGELKFGRAKFSGLTLANAAFALNAANGAVRLTPSADLYGGRLTGDIRVQVDAAAARMNVQQSLTGVDIAALGQALLGSQDITGTGDVQLSLVTAGSNLGEMRRDLDGDVAFAVANGSIEGIDFWYELRRARARLDSAAVPERGDAPRRTMFSSLSATGVVEDALLTNRDLNARLDFMTIDGTGTVNLLDDSLNFDLTATLVDGPVLQSDAEMAKMAGDAVPLRVTGTVAEPSITPDFAALVRERVSEEVQERVDERRDEVQEEVRDRLRDRLRNALER